MFIDSGSLTSTASIEAAGSRKGLNAFNTRPLPDGYVLGENDVICGRGAQCFNHSGNRRFRLIVQSQLHRYSNENATKMDKTAVIQDIVNYIRLSSPNGGFVKLDLNTNTYYEVGDFLAREKTSQAFRDALSIEYRSSNENKKIRRSIQREKQREHDQSKLHIDIPAECLTTTTTSTGCYMSSNSGSTTEYQVQEQQYQVQVDVPSVTPSANVDQHQPQQQAVVCGDAELEYEYTEPRTFTMTLVNNASSGYGGRRLSMVETQIPGSGCKRFSLTTSFVPIADEECDEHFNELAGSQRLLAIEQNHYTGAMNNNSEAMMRSSCYKNTNGLVSSSVDGSNDVIVLI